MNFDLQQGWVIAILSGVAVFLVLFVVLKWVHRTLDRVSRQVAHSEAVEILRVGLPQWISVGMGLWVFMEGLHLQPNFEALCHRAFLSALLIHLAVVGYRILISFVDRFENERSTNGDLVTQLRLARVLLGIAYWTAFGLLLLDNLGIHVTPILAGLGIGGVAIALALQSVLGDVFASLSIALDKPFVIGDTIVMGDVSGTVEAIGIKTTRVRSMSGEQISISNSELLKNTIRNYKRMSERRVQFSFGVTYETSPALLEKIPKWVQEIIETTPKTRFDRAHLKTLGSSSLDYEVVYWAMFSEFNAHMDILQAVNFSLIKKFEEHGISFAYPTQVSYTYQMETRAEVPRV